MEVNHLCKYCNKTYSRFNEALLIVCLCEGKVKYAHGSCFRDSMKVHDYGVCGSCLTKTKIVPDGRKSIKKAKCPDASAKVVFSIIFAILWLAGLLGVLIWMLVTQCWEAYCIAIVSVLGVLLLFTLLLCVGVKEIRKFWKTYSINSHYWKVIYCYEETVGKKVTRRYSDVPLTIPSQSVRKSIYDDIQEDHKQNGTNIYNFEFSVNDFSGEVDAKPAIWSPTNYPYVKKNPLYLNKEIRRSKRGDSDASDVASTSRHDSNFTSVLGADSESGEFYFATEPYTRGNDVINSTLQTNSSITKDYNGNLNMAYTHDENYGRKLQSNDKQPSRNGSVYSNASRLSRERKQSANKHVPISYIDQRADSFYKNSNGKRDGYDLDKYRNLVRAKHQSKRDQYELYGSGKGDVKRARSEPDVRKKETTYLQFNKLFKSTSNHDIYSDTAGKFRFKNNSKSDSTPSVMPQESDIVFKSSSYFPPSDSNTRKMSRQNPKSKSAYTPSNKEFDAFPVQRARSMYFPKESDDETSSIFENKFIISRQNSVERSTPEPKHKHWKSKSDPAINARVVSNIMPSNIAFEPNPRQGQITPQKRPSKAKIQNKSTESTPVLIRDESKNQRTKKPITNNITKTNETLENLINKPENSEDSLEKKERKRKISKQKKDVLKDERRELEKHERQEIERIMSTPLDKLDVSELFKDTQSYGKKRPSLFQGMEGSDSLFFAPN